MFPSALLNGIISSSMEKRELRNPRINIDKQKEEKINVKATKKNIDYW